jgi:dTMP kinase
LFITFEGPEGSGKSTHSKLLCEYLKNKGFDVLHTREPGGTDIGEGIRGILLDPENTEMDVTCEMFLYMAARAQIMKEKILPAVKNGTIVVCDRFLDATIAYQGYAGNVDIDIIKDMGKLVTDGVRPDITFLMDIDSEKGLFRSGKIKDRDRMENKSLEYHKKVREGYLSIAREEPDRVKVISAVGDISETQEKIRKMAEKML